MCIGRLHHFSTPRGPVPESEIDSYPPFPREARCSATPTQEFGSYSLPSPSEPDIGVGTTNKTGVITKNRYNPTGVQGRWFKNGATRVSLLGKRSFPSSSECTK